ncbi:Periplasmic [NiFeSe] hydrogenase small subunit precursor [Caloramator mitchellensis]|uniref:Periplasmic [NiFeSe] hydrogenase small subunit n=1 Tax=Caloramator mitchellensis TaxID=908809 RepID=A0A0R3JRQ4_CALMK|nr:hypothetical protein [Caloramator mitchellensis]KRQ86160.1 Periplasmic [NiFeSe] hydrogenase small subunit precursor [Caloramator mitchellensis]
MRDNLGCYNEVLSNKNNMAHYIAMEAVNAIKTGRRKKINVIWIEATGCFGNTISLMNGKNPDLGYLLSEMINLEYSNSIMTCEGEGAFELFLKAMEKDFILVVEGAIATRQDGFFNVIANYKGRKITALEAIKQAAEV